MLKQRIITAVILAAAFFGALFGLSSMHFAVLMMVALVTASWEWAQLSGLAKGATIAFCAVVLAAEFALLHYIGFDQTTGFRAMPPVVIICGLASVFWIVIAPLWLKNEWSTRGAAAMSAIGVVLLVAVWVAMAQLHARSPWLLLAVMLIVWLADTAAYFSGRKFGRRKLAPTISPNKSWEGVYGGLISVVIYAMLVVTLSSLSSLSSLSTQPMAVRVAIVVVALLLGGISVVGDLFESLMKRQAKVKDSGHTLPGHGGVLDRIDAQLPVLPIATLATLALTRLS